MSKEKKTAKELISDVFDSAPKEPNTFEVFDDPKPTQNENDSVPTAIPTATWNPNIMNTIFGGMPQHNWTISSVVTKFMPLVPVNMQFNLNCIRKGDNVVVTIWHYEDAVRLVSQATLNGEISEISPDRMVISVVNPISSDNTEIILTPADMINNSRCKYAITCGSSTYYYQNTFGCNDRTMPWNQAIQQSQF